ncbi:unnamed protein product [Ectocarpus sp. 12 AP-2014]
MPRFPCLRQHLIRHQTPLISSRHYLCRYSRPTFMFSLSIPPILPSPTYSPVPSQVQTHPHLPPLHICSHLYRYFGHHATAYTYALFARSVVDPVLFCRGTIA